MRVCGEGPGPGRRLDQRKQEGCVTKLPVEMQHTCLLIPDRDPTTDQSTGTTEVPLGEPRSLIRVTQRNVGQGLLTATE